MTPWTSAHQASLSFTISWSLLKLISIESVMPPNHLILCQPLLLPTICPRIRVFFSESTILHRWPKYWSCNFSISPSNEFPLGFTGLISQSKGLSRVLSSTIRKHQSLTLSFLDGPTLTSIHDYWENHSIDSMDLCQQSDV